MTPAPLGPPVIGTGRAIDLPVPRVRARRPEPPSPPPAGPLPEVLEDRHGRTVRDLRLSLTDRCNLRCTYCMPAEGMDWLPSPSLLSAEEIIRLARLAVTRLGVERIRLTGGEPLMRRDLEEVVAGLAALRTRSGARPDIGMTTNGLGLDRRADALRRAGLERVNISIDSLDRGDYAALTRRDRLPDVLAGIAGAQDAGLSPIKVNAVALPGAVGQRAPRLLRECLRRGWQLRFIEHMPLGPAGSWRREEVVVVEEILGALRAAGFELEEAGRPDRRPAALWRVRAGEDHPGGTVGIIASVSAPFCADCDRTRITADGRLMTCLFSCAETDLRGPMRAGASDEDLMRLWARAAWLKPRAHGSDAAPSAGPVFSRPQRTMSAIGG
ncbi:GTP 3',8-cyclase MoaA [Actinomyces bowdenii]|uniref:GTP 3',8-cyclase n=1 Tax=Actinomyces bowdenii TaxID=131109 RepID=A0A3P1V9Z9_9ACTO|nr:GTP 3',8-cyclase MoaA [Actinomyces bowdenii]RRD30330.1 GTP 3',8-cyclase MoaA [Actinomyces bowdenii]